MNDELRSGTTPSGRSGTAPPGIVGSIDPASHRLDQPPRCKGVTKAGKPCGATPTTSSGGKWCPTHSPAYSPEQRKAWRQRGALSLHHRRLTKESTAVAKQVAAVAPTLPPDVPLPPVPDPTARVPSTTP